MNDNDIQMIGRRGRALSRSCDDAWEGDGLPVTTDRNFPFGGASPSFAKACIFALRPRWTSCRGEG